MNKKKTNNIFKEDELLNESESLVSVLKLADRTIVSIPLEIVQYSNNRSIYINKTRITPFKPYGYGNTECTINLTIKDLENIIKTCTEAIDDIKKFQETMNIKGNS